MKKTYLFDLYGTLVDIRTNEDKIEVWQKLSLFYGYYGAIYTPEELKQAYQKEVNSAETEAKKESSGSVECKAADAHEANPEIQLEYVFKKLFEQKGVQADLAQSTYAGQIFRIASTEYVRLYEGAKELLQTLRDKGSKIYLLSNAQSIFTRYEMKYLGIDHLFDDIFISSEYGFKKPDDRFYNIPIKKYGLKAEETMMIGNDYVCDILGAQQVGLDTFYIHSNLSPDITTEIKSTYYLMEMDLNKVSSILNKE